MASSKKKAAPAARLGVLLDGVALSDDEARAIWVEFSRHMDEHEGDFAGFAKKRGWASVKPEPRGDRAVLVVSTKQ